ncbi:MAG: helix-turn-helix transcriptional regulator [Treponema sp.]|nr:helix-turn-helix transcriptional regulator [Treponema sp.]
MRTTVEIVEILENYLKEKKISLRQFSALVDIPHSTILTWKKKNTLPSIEFISRIAAFMNVSLDWLVNGEIAEGLDNSYENPCSRRSILYRIEIVLRQKNVDYDYDTESLYNKYLKDIVEYEVLMNWVAGRANMPEDVLPKIAARLDVSLQWLLTKDEYHQQDFDAYIYGLASKYPGLLKGYNCLDEEDQKFIDHYITSRLEVQTLKRQAELNKKDDQ